MNNETKNKFAEILAAQKAKVNGIKPIIPKPEPIKNEKKQPEQIQELSSITIDDLLNTTHKPLLNLVDYSDKSFAITGETYPIKAQLKALGGKFNYHLTCGAGWIFNKAKAYTVRRALNLI